MPLKIEIQQILDKGNLSATDHRAVCTGQRIKAVTVVQVVDRLLRNAKSDKDRYNIGNIYSIKHNMLYDLKRMS